MEYQTDTGKIVFESLWKTSAGNLVPVVDMETDHLVNTIDYLERRYQEADMPVEYVLPFNEVGKSKHNIQVLKRELVRRG